MRALDLVPISEFQLVTETIRRFRMGYVAAFGAPERDDLLYEAVSEGRRHPGMEHWLPLFQERMDTLFDYLDGAPVAIEPQGEDAARERFKQIADYYEARARGAGASRRRRDLQAAAAGPALSDRGRVERSGSTTRRWRG